MDLRDIQRLHEQYAQGPLTIDVEAAPIAAALPAPKARSRGEQADGKRAQGAYLIENRKVILMMVLVAAIALPVGMFIASATKQSNAVPAVQATANDSERQRDGGLEASSTRWPDTPSVADVEAAVPHPESDAASKPAPSPSKALPQRPVVQTEPEPKARPTPPAQKTPASEVRKQEATSRAAVVPQKQNPAGGEIRLF